jgi:hypothetical protein
MELVRCAHKVCDSDVTDQLKKESEKYDGLAWNLAKKLDTPAGYDALLDGFGNYIKYLDQLEALGANVSVERQYGIPLIRKIVDFNSSKVAAVYVDFVVTSSGVTAKPKRSGATASTPNLVNGRWQSVVTVGGYSFKWTQDASFAYPAPMKPPKAFSKAARPKISGTAKVGKTLKVKVGKWSPKPKFKYQWYANGKAIKKATKATFKVAKAQVGKKITVKVTGSKTGYKTKTVTSKATAKVKKKGAPRR